MRNVTGPGRHLLGALYAWLAAVFLGAVLLDVVYSSFLKDTDAPFIAPVFSEVSDFLLMLGASTLLAALLAIAASWNSRATRNLFALSLLVLLVAEFLVPIILFPVLRTSPEGPLLGITPYVRLAPIALASLLAAGAYRDLLRESTVPSSH